MSIESNMKYGITLPVKLAKHDKQHENEKNNVLCVYLLCLM